MADFLTICRDVARESGTISGVKPETVVGQSGRLLKIIDFVKEAWNEIQTNERSWKWMRRDYILTVDAPTQAYTPLSLGLIDLRRWDVSSPLFIYATINGKQSEGELYHCKYRDFRQRFLKGVITPQQSQFYSIRPQDNAFYLSTLPDQEYRITGEYFKTKQTLVGDTDVPEMPEEFHVAIQWLALKMLFDSDEAYNIAAAHEIKYSNVYTDLLNDQTEETIDDSEPIA